MSSQQPSFRSPHCLCEPQGGHSSPPLQQGDDASRGHLIPLSSTQGAAPSIPARQAFNSLPAVETPLPASPPVPGLYPHHISEGFSSISPNLLPCSIGLWLSLSQNSFCPSTISSSVSPHHPQVTTTPPWEQPRKEPVLAAAQPCTEEKATPTVAHSAQGQQPPAATVQPAGPVSTQTGKCILRSIRFQPWFFPDMMWRPSESNRSTEPLNQGKDSCPGRSLQDQPQELLSAQP